MNRTCKWESFVVLSLFAGYYGLVAGLMSLVAAGAWLASKAVRGFPENLWMLAVLAASWLLLRSATGWRRRFAGPGPRLDRAQEPELFRVIDEMALRLQVAPPEDVYLYNHVNAAVLSRDTILGFGGRRALVIGLPLFGVLNVDELRAILAHEFGHFAGDDTRLGVWVDSAYRSMSQTHRLLLLRQRSWISALFRAYIRMFLRVVRSISRKRELRADEHAARAVGRAANLSVERRLNHWSIAYGQYWRMDAAPMLASGFQPPLLEGFRMFLSGRDGRKWVAEALESLEPSESDPFATHPPSEERIAAFESMPDDGIGMDTRPASRLLRDVAVLEQQLVEFQFGRPETAWSISWDQVGEVYTRRWEHHIDPHWRTLAAYTMADVPRLFRNPELVAWDFHLGPSEAMAAEEYINAARGVLVSAAALVMIREGWRVDAQPGRALTFRTPDGEPATAPWQVLAILLEPGATDTQWRLMVERAGLSDAPLL